MLGWRRNLHHEFAEGLWRLLGRPLRGLGTRQEVVEVEVLVEVDLVLVVPLAGGPGAIDRAEEALACLTHRRKGFNAKMDFGPCSLRAEEFLGLSV